jgi:hypothetical protein
MCSRLLIYYVNNNNKIIEMLFLGNAIKHSNLP